MKRKGTMGMSMSRRGPCLEGRKGFYGFSNYFDFYVLDMGLCDDGDGGKGCWMWRTRICVCV